MKTAALIVAAGRGTRAGPGAPKQWRPLAGRRVADWTIAAFAAHPGIDLILTVTHPEDAAEAATLGVETVPGGASRAASVRAGLEALVGRGVTHVLIHDVARAGITPEIISDILAALETSPGAAPAIPVTDALWRGTDGRVTGTEDRTALYRAQTPQGFAFDAILAAHRAHPGEAADDVEVARAAGLDVAIVPGNESNLKITAPEDFARMEKSLRGTMDIRLGNGFDVHAFDDGGDHVTLCGVHIPHTRGLKGHSDADVGMHAVTDAIYGALAMGDIGRHFPPSDMQWKGADSAIFLDHAVKLAAEHGFTISNIDCTLICERPKIGPHAAAMTDRMAEIMGLEAARISIKATTSEKLGFTGREEGIAALATATLVKA
jgi:2-C-methyl-D-erythritol 4-phosphate cytidylyltransferase/2-C-methyl-D-erythritol 2,4-cyclodiphosphate synthase